MDQELEEGLRAIAAPIRGSGDAVTAAINMSAHASRVQPLTTCAPGFCPRCSKRPARIETDFKVGLAALSPARRASGAIREDPRTHT